MELAVERFFQLSLLGLVSAGFLAVAGSGFLDRPTVVLVALGLALRAAHVARWIQLELPEVVVNLVTLAYIGFFAADYFVLSRGLLEATVHLVCFLAVVKVLTARADRDHLYTAAIALLELVAAAMLSVNLNFFAYLAVYLVCAIAASTSGEIRRGLSNPGRTTFVRTRRLTPRLAAVTLILTTGILILTAAMFVVLPRSANAAFRHFAGARSHLSGFSSEVTLGEVGRLKRDTRAVMHVLPYSQSMPADLKWRGAALTHFDGHTWTDPDFARRIVLPRKPPVELAGPVQRSRRDGIRFSYRVDLNLSDSDALFTAGTPEFLILSSGSVSRTTTGGFRFASANAERLRYELSSFLARPAPPTVHVPLTPAERAPYLQLPVLDPRIATLARQLRSPEAIERHFRTQFGYTLDLPPSSLADPLANFLFERKRGHCEYFSSAMTVMLRTLGIPARVVNGFQSGQFNPVSGLYVIRASDAHSWVEAWLPTSGWTSFDPTPYLPREPQNAFLARAALYLDAAETFWQEWVLNYDLSRQVDLAERLQASTQRAAVDWNPDFRLWRASWTEWAAAHKALLGVLATALILFPLTLPQMFRFLRNALHAYQLKRGRATARDASVLYARMLSLVKARGYEKPPWFTAAEFAASLPATPLAEEVRAFTGAFQAFRYGGDASAGSRLVGLLERIRVA